MGPEQTQRDIQAGARSSLTSRMWVCLLVIIGLLIAGGGYLFLKNNMGSGYRIRGTTEAFNEEAKVVLTKDFVFPPEQSFDIYQIMYSMNNVSYRIFINDKLIDSGNPEFDGFGGLPLDRKVFRSTNTLRVEINPHESTGAFNADSACDVSLIGANKDNVVSTNSEENSNTLVRVICGSLNLTP